MALLGTEGTAATAEAITGVTAVGIGAEPMARAVETMEPIGSVGKKVGNPVGTPERKPVGTPVEMPEGKSVGKLRGTPVEMPEGKPVVKLGRPPVGTPVETPEGKPDGTPRGTPVGKPVGKTWGIAVAKRAFERRGSRVRRYIVVCVWVFEGECMVRDWDVG